MALVTVQMVVEHVYSEKDNTGAVVREQVQLSLAPSQPFARAGFTIVLSTPAQFNKVLPGEVYDVALTKVVTP